jgi:glycosyltransferase involved in cell wall biosynthesis
MSKLSVALAAYNEEENLAKTLESVREIADEIVVYDGGSTDKTVEIAKSFGAKVISGKNYPVFHINKQKAIDACTNDWILQLDADEIVPPELASEIRSIVNGKSSIVNGYWIPRKNYFLGRFLMKGGQYPDYTIRLYRRGKGRLPQKDVHEQAVIEGKVGCLKNALLHYPYKDFATYVKKWGRYNNLISAQIKEKLSNKNALSRAAYGFGYLIIKPAHWFVTTYGRHKGFMDSWQGFVFSLFSSLRFPVSYIKYLTKRR